jgi:hypothetical protein
MLSFLQTYVSRQLSAIIATNVTTPTLQRGKLKRTVFPSELDLPDEA